MSFVWRYVSLLHVRYCHASFISDKCVKVTPHSWELTQKYIIKLGKILQFASPHIGMANTKIIDEMFENLYFLRKEKCHFWWKNPLEPNN